jgi:hypothetical protein
MEKLRRIKRPNGAFVVRRRRAGVEPGGGCLLLAPIWLVTRLRWQFGTQRQWAVELGVVPPSRLGGLIKPVERTVWDSRSEADEAMRDLITRLDRGDLDDRLPQRQ